MVNNNTADTRKPDLALASKAVWGYVGLTVAALIAPVVMTGLAPQLATDEAWGTRSSSRSSPSSCRCGCAPHAAEVPVRCAQ
jgi:hypothetical protein